MVQADSLKNLGAAIALHGGDTHLGHGLDHTFDGCLDEVLDRFLVGEFRQHPLLNHVVQRFKGKVRVDGVDAIAEQYGEVMYFARLSRFKDQRNPGPGAATDQMVVQAGYRQQSRNGCVAAVNTPVGQNQNIAAGYDSGIGSGKQCFQRFLHCTGAVSCREKQRQCR